MGRPKAIVRDITPPVLYRLASKLRREQPSERGSDWYDEVFLEEAHWKAPYWRTPWYHLWAVIVDRIEEIDRPSVLDIGCGPGHLAAFLRDRGLRSYVGFDFSQARIKHARNEVPELRFEVADAFDTDLYDTLGYNTVVCCEVLEHLDNDLDVIRRVRSGTRVLATVPNFDHPEHVRHFMNADEVAARYGKFFDHVRVDAFPAPSDGYEHFLLDGVMATGG